MPEHARIPLKFSRMSKQDQIAASRAFRDTMSHRRTVRDFSEEPVEAELIENAIRTAALAPSGANQQPWRFVVVSDSGIKRRIREAAEREEKEFYEHRCPPEWLEAIAPLGTDWRKPFRFKSAGGSTRRHPMRLRCGTLVVLGNTAQRSSGQCQERIHHRA
jgi:nitroreductase